MADEKQTKTPERRTRDADETEVTQGEEKKHGVYLDADQKGYHNAHGMRVNEDGKPLGPDDAAKVDKEREKAAEEDAKAKREADAQIEAGQLSQAETEQQARAKAGRAK